MLLLLFSHRRQAQIPTLFLPSAMCPYPPDYSDIELPLHVEFSIPVKLSILASGNTNRCRGSHWGCHKLVVNTSQRLKEKVNVVCYDITCTEAPPGVVQTRGLGKIAPLGLPHHRFVIWLQDMYIFDMATHSAKSIQSSSRGFSMKLMRLMKIVFFQNGM